MRDIIYLYRSDYLLFFEEWGRRLFTKREYFLIGITFQHLNKIQSVDFILKQHILIYIDRKFVMFYLL